MTKPRIGGEYCEFSPILFSAFYSTTGTVAGSGVASMQFGSRRNHGLSVLQDDVVTAEFDLPINIAAAGDGFSAEISGGATLGTVCAVTFGLLNVDAML